MNWAENETITGSNLLALGDGEIGENCVVLLTASTAIQKIVPALIHVQLLNGSFFATVVSASTYKFPLFESTNITAWLPVTHVFFIGRINSTTGIDCYDCQLHLYINTSDKFNPHNQSLMILQQHTHIWLPSTWVIFGLQIV